MRQSSLPGFPDGAEKVGEGLAILEKGGQVIYFVGRDNYFSHAVGDDASRRFALASLMENGPVKAVELGEAAVVHFTPHADELGRTKPQSWAVVFLSAGGAEQAADYDAEQQCQMCAAVERGEVARRAKPRPGK